MENQIPLTERLEQVGTNNPVFLNAFELFPDDYFSAFAELTGKPYFQKVYQKTVKPFHDRQDHFCVLSELIFFAGELPRERREKMLFRILIEPFAHLKNRKE